MQQARYFAIIFYYMLKKFLVGRTGRHRLMSKPLNTSLFNVMVSSVFIVGTV